MAYFLIKHGADLNARSNSGNTAMHYAVETGQYEIVCMLLYYGAEADTPNMHGRTPFMLALHTKNVKMHETLVNYVVDVNLRCEETQFSLLLLTLEARSPSYKELVENGADVNYSVYFTNSLKLALFYPTNEAFKIIWNKFNFRKVYTCTC